MRLTEALILSYLKLQFPDADPLGLELKRKQFLNRVKSGKSNLADYFVCVDNDGGSVMSSLSIFALQAGVYGISSPKGRSFQSGLSELLDEAIGRAHELRARVLHFRIEKIAENTALIASLPSRGFKKSHTRIEYRAELSDLPDESGTPLSWDSLIPAGKCTLEDAASILEKAGQGDPDWSPDDNSLELLKSYLSDSDLLGEPECVQIARFNGSVAGIVIAQINPVTKWSRITYMGLLPEFRGQGLGKWVHRHGFVMMREQGGKTYQGGTLQGNRLMQKLFVKHGCREFRALEEWVKKF